MTKTLVDELREDADTYHDARADDNDCWNVTAALERKAADELTQLRGNLTLAEEGLASAMQEIERLQRLLKDVATDIHPDIYGEADVSPDLMKRIRAEVEGRTPAPSSLPCAHCEAPELHVEIERLQADKERMLAAYNALVEATAAKMTASEPGASVPDPTCPRCGWYLEVKAEPAPREASPGNGCEHCGGRGDVPRKYPNNLTRVPCPFCQPNAVKSGDFVCPTHGPVQQLTDSGDCPMCIQDRTAART